MELGLRERCVRGRAALASRRSPVSSLRARFSPPPMNAPGDSAPRAGSAAGSCRAKRSGGALAAGCVSGGAAGCVKASAGERGGKCGGREGSPSARVGCAPVGLRSIAATSWL